MRDDAKADRRGERVSPNTQDVEGKRQKEKKKKKKKCKTRQQSTRLRGES